MKTKKRKEEFTFWKDNRKDGEFKMSVVELRKAYAEWLSKKDIDWVYYYGHQTVVWFITEKEGFSSVFEQTDLEELQDELMPTRHAIYP